MRLILGDSWWLSPPVESIDALVCDPPAGISFMGKAFDSDRGGRDEWIEWLTGVMQLVYMAMKPGAHGLVWALPRTSHWTATALEDAGFEIRDIVSHIFGSGFPKSLDVSKAIDGAAGVEPCGFTPNPAARPGNSATATTSAGWAKPQRPPKPIATSPDAQRWHGWGTALKPAAEHWILVRKPLSGTVAANVLEHGTGGINVEACRVGMNVDDRAVVDRRSGAGWGTQQGAFLGRDAGERFSSDPAGRWPPHLLLSHSADCTDRCEPGCPIREMDEQSGESVSAGGNSRNVNGWVTSRGLPDGIDPGFGDSGGASRYFPRFRYQAKPSRAEREAGCGHLPARTGAEAVDREEGSAGLDNPRAGAGRTAAEVRNPHPTLKGLDLMRWLVRLITPPGGTVLDPFMGSGTTGCAAVCEGFGFVGIEQDPEYIQIARARIEYYSAARHDVENDDRERPAGKGQATLW